MNPLFEKIAIKNPETSVFDMSHDNKLSLNMGELVPIMCKEVLPGDVWKGNAEVMIRLAPMLAPVLHRINAYVHYFFVPNRILWNDSKADCWETFITGGEDGDSDAVPPYVELNYNSVTALDSGTLADYLGYNFQHIVSSWPDDFTLKVSCLPLRAYLKIYNDYYRDQNLTDEIEYPVTGGEDTTDLGVYFTLRKRCWEKDYFTSALPFAQRGDAVQIPFTGSFDASPNQKIYNVNGQQVYNTFLGSNGEGVFSARSLAPSYGDFVESVDFTTGTTEEGSAVTSVGSNGSINLKLDVSQSIGNAATIEDLRTANRVQRWLERNARAGARYVEQILAHFNVRVPDYRLDRAEFLGGGKQPVVISEVLQTSSTDSTTPQGNMSGHGIVGGGDNSFSFRAEEHGFIIAILSVLPRTGYCQGLDKMLTRFDRFDYAWPEFANLGEQPVLKQELYVGTDETANNSTFGYQSRFSEYKFANNEIHGDFKTNLAYWHMGRIFDSQPSLNSSFVNSDPTTRIFAVQTDVDHLYAMVYFNIRVSRKLPFYSNPIL